jgi:hypothetical protein
MSPEQKCLEAALKYAARGWYVCAGDDGYTTSEARIRQHYSKKHLNAVVQINLELSGLVTVNFGGVADLAKLGIPPEIETLRTTENLFFKKPVLSVLPTGKVASDVAVITKGDVYVPPTAGCGEWINSSDEPAQMSDTVAAELVEARSKYKKDEQHNRNEWPEPLDLVALSQHTPELPKFIVDDWLPCGYATLFAGHGGVGKSGIALHLAVCVAAGIPFFGLRVAQRRVLYLACEDRENILHWRLARICSFLRIELASLHEWLEVLDLVGQPTVLWERDPKTGNSFTTAYGNLHSRIRAGESQVLVADGIADVFGGNENSRTEVKAFVNSLLALVPPDDGAVLLVGHISKPVANNSATTEGYSGSTGWHNSVRARWYLYPEKDVEGLRLELQKSNLGPTDRAMNFQWDAERHLFVGSAVTEFDSQQRDEDERAGIIAAMKACPVPVPTAASGPCTTFHVLSIRPEFPSTLKDAKGKKRFWRHIEVLRQRCEIAEKQYQDEYRNKKKAWEVQDEKF